MGKRCFEDKDNKIILNNIDIFNNFHIKNNTQNLTINSDIKIIIPVTINICLTNSKYSIDFIKYSKYIIDVLNDGFAGKIKNKYKSPEYTETFFSIISNSIPNGKIIYNYINYKFDSNIRFFLNSIVYHNKNFEQEFTNTDTELLIENFYKNGFIVRDEHKNNLHINIMKFNCATLGVSTFPWDNLIKNYNKNNPMFVFVDYKTIHPDLSNSKFNDSRTIIHETGHIFGLKHIFKNNLDSINAYKILLGDKIFFEIFDNSKYNLVCPDCNQDLDDSKLYPDIIGQNEPTTKNPIEKKIFILKNNIPVNFACFMDYSPDEVLTHFTISQCKIMRAIIYIYKNNLILDSHKYEKKNKNKTNLYLPPGFIANFKNNKFSIKSNTSNSIQHIHKVIFNSNLEYTIKKDPKIIELKIEIN